MTSKILDLKGGEILQPGGEPFTLRSVLSQALLASAEDTKLSGEKKWQHFQLAMICTGEDCPDLKIEDIALLKKLVGDLFPPLTVGRVWQILDPAS